MSRLKFYYLSLLVALISCRDQRIDNISILINETQSAYAPDGRTAIFNISISPENPVVLAGETNVADAKNALEQKLDSAGIDFIDQIQILPIASLEDSTFALINVSVANLRSHPRHSAELVTQALLGTPVELLKKQGGWYLIQTPDQYIGWTNGGSLVQMNLAGLEDWKAKSKIIFLETYGFSYDQNSRRISDLVCGNILELVSETDDVFHVRYPDGRMAKVHDHEAAKLEDWAHSQQISDSTLIAQAQKLMGVPYLWGGTSSKGVDCSGFTKTVYLMHGLILPRDASQQVYKGKLVDDKKDFSHLEVGDLLFFGRHLDDGTERVVHVGMWIGDNKFIHASGDVHISSMESTTDQFDEYNFNRYLRTKRIIGHDEDLPADFHEVFF